MMPPDGTGEAGLLAGHAGMDDRSKPAELPWMPKHDPSQGRAVQRSVGAQDLPAEGGDNLPPGGFVRFDHLSCEDIRVDDVGPATLQHLGHGAFAGRHPAC
jgi:hypothetical protein